MGRNSSLIQFWILCGGFWHAAESVCYDFVNGNSAGQITPRDLAFVAEGTTLRIECSLTSAFAVSHNLTADDINWRNPNYDLLSPDTNKRVTLTTWNQTSVLEIRNISSLDDGGYYCYVVIGGQTRRVCSIEVPVSGPPKKYTDLRCGSDSHRNFACRWKRSDYYTGRSRMKYTLKYRTDVDSDLHDCPQLTYDRDGWHKCEWSSALMKSSTAIRMLRQANMWFLAINGTNTFSSHVWTEQIIPQLLVRPEIPANLTADLWHDNSCVVQWDANGQREEDIVRHSHLLVAQIEVAKSKKCTDEEEWTTAADDIEDFHYNLKDLAEYTNYSIRVRIRPKRGDPTVWSNYGITSCTTRGSAQILRTRTNKRERPTSG